MMTLRALALVTAPLYAVAACGEEVPVWDDVPPVTLEVGGSSTLDLDDYVDDRDGSDGLLLMTVYGGSASTGSASLDAATHVVTFKGAASFEGEVTFEVTAADADGNTASTLVTVAAGGGTLPGEVPTRSCATTFTYTGAASSVAVAGQFNGWSTTASPLTDPDRDGTFTADLSLAAGRWQYKLVINGATWMLDPENPYQAMDGGIVNSMVKVPDCTLPLVTLTDLSTLGGRLRAELQYHLGSGQASMPASPIRATVAGKTVSVSVDATTGAATVDVPAAAAGKYTLQATGLDAAGAAGETLTRPVWVETRAFDWRDAVLYFAFTDRFFNGAQAGDAPIPGVATAANYQGGDWAGLAEKIEAGYFDDLGVDAIWISPLRDNPEHAEYGADGRLYTGYHGYWPEGAGVEERFGGAAALQDLVATAHAHGIRIMLDLVANHVHDEHPWYTSHPEWFNPYDWCGDGGSWDTNPVGCWFMDYLPDLDFKAEDPLYAMLDASMALLTDYDLDGVRLDAVKHMEQVFERDLVASIEEQLETDDVQIYTVGETFTGTWDASGYNQGLIKAHVGPGLLDGQFDFPLYWDIVKAFARDEEGLDALNATVEASAGYYGPTALMSTFLGNHDVPRFISHANGDIGDVWGNGAQEQGWTNPPAQPTATAPYDRLRMAFTFLMTQSGVPLIYYGDEVGLAGAGDPDNRRPMPWTGLSASQTAVRTHVGALSAIRKDHPALSRGSRTTLLADTSGLAYGRVLGSDKLVVAFNRAGSTRSLTLNVSGLGLASGTVLTDELSGATVTVSGATITFTLAARQSAIYAAP